MKEKVSLREVLVLCVSMLIISAVIYYVMMPGGFVMGSVSGLVLILIQVIPMKASTLTLIINGGLLIVGYIFIDRSFGVKTVITSLLLPFYLGVFEKISPHTESLTGNLVIDMGILMVVLSFGQAIIFSMNASTGGLDIVAKLLNKYLHLKIGVSLAIVGYIIAGLSIFVYDRQTMFISLAATYINGRILDNYCDGFMTRKRVCILSENYEKIKDYIINDLGRGATLYQVIGGMSDEKRIEIETVLEKNEYQKLMAYLRENESDAFVTVSTVAEVVGQWNAKKRRLFAK